MKELLTPFLVALGLFTFIFMVGNLVKLADLLVNKGVGIIDIFKLLILLLPQLITFILPTSALAAVLLIFGGFAQNNEINAMKASGVNVLRVMYPVMAIAFLLSLVSLFFIDQLQPRAHHLFRQVFNDLAVKRPEAYIESGRFVKDFKGYILRVQKVNGKRLEGITIFQPQDGKPTRTIIAEWGEITPSPDDKMLGLKLHNGVSDEPNPDNPSVVYKMHFETFMLPAMNLSDNNPGEKTKRKIKDMPLNNLLLTLRNMNQYREKLEAEQRGKLEGDRWDKTDIERNIQDLTRETKTEIQRKISFSFATFCFVLAGLPLAIITRRGEVIVSFTLSMGVVAVYYLFSIWGQTMSIHGILPPLIAMWLPNILVAGTAIFLMSKVVRL